MKLKFKFNRAVLTTARERIAKFADRRAVYALFAALFVIALMVSPTLAQSGITFYTGLGVVNDGSASAPQYTFFNDLDTGLYRIGSDNVGLTLGGTKILDASSSGLAVTGSISASSGITNTTNMAIVAPTSVASATPVVRINSLGANNDLLVVEKNSTPVFKISNGGIVTSNGLKCVNGTQNVLGAATVIPATLTASGISTPAFVQSSLAGDIGTTHQSLSNANAAGVVTLKTWSLQLAETVTPQAATTTVAVDYLVCGQ